MAFWLEKPVPTEAVQWTGANFAEVLALGGAAVTEDGAVVHVANREDVAIGDYVLKSEFNGDIQSMEQAVWEENWELAP